MDAALDGIIREGLEERIKRHEKIVKALRCALRKIGLELFVEDRFASKTVTAVKLPPAVNGEQLRKVIADDFNILLSGGLGETKDSVVRIGHMGMTAQSKYILPTLKALERTLSELGFSVEEGRAQKTFKGMLLLK